VCVCVCVCVCKYFIILCKETERLWVFISMGAWNQSPMESEGQPYHSPYIVRTSYYANIARDI
jgi:hypothetical protein